MQINISLAFIAGVLSFLSPCVLPLIPAYIALITGLTFKELEEEKSKYFIKLVIESILFVFGFSAVFISFFLIATYFGNYIPRQILRLIGGIIVIILGFHVMGVFSIKALKYTKKLDLGIRSRYMGESFIIGAIFAFGWSPCVGPILGSILMYASVQETFTKGFFLLITYCIGLGIPFLLISILGIGLFSRLIRKFKKFYKSIELVSGILLVIIGTLILLNKFWGF